MKVKVNKDVCIGCGTCMSLCADVFEFDKNNKSQVKKDADIEKNQKCIETAKDSCPVQAIDVE